MKNESENVILLPCSYTRMNSKLICTCKDFNIIYSIDLNNGAVELLGGIPQIPLASPEGCSCAANYNGAVYFIMEKGGEIWVRDDSDKWEKIQLTIQNEKNTKVGFNQCVIYHNKLFLIGYDYPIIISINLDNRKIKYIDSIFDIFPDNMKRRHFWVNYAVQDDYLYLSSVRINKVLKFNMENDSYCWTAIGKKENSYTGIACSGGSFWLAPKKGSEIIWWDGLDSQKPYKLPDEILAGRYHIPEIQIQNQHVLFHDYIKNKSVEFNPHIETFNISTEHLYRDRILDGIERIKIYSNGHIKINGVERKERNVYCWFKRSVLKDFISEFDHDGEMYLLMATLGGNMLHSNEIKYVKSDNNGVGSDIWEKVRNSI